MFEPGVKAQIFQGTLESIMLENAVVDHVAVTNRYDNYWIIVLWINVLD